jgi:hypothetical protein
VRKTAISSKPSKAKREFDAIYAAVLPSVLARGCEFETYSQGRFPHAGCSGRLVGHHAMGRDLRHPEISNDPRNLRCLCDYHHHGVVHANPRWSREVGLMLSRIS